MLKLRKFMNTTGSRYSSSVSHLKDVCNKRLQGYRKAGTLKTDKVIVTNARGPVLQYQGCKKEILNFCSCDCYGLAFHQEVMKAARSALDRFGLGLCAPRYCCGTQDLHKELEAKIAQFHDRDDAIVYPSCYHANIGLFNALLGPDDVVFSDELNHASIISGLQLSKSRKIVYKHKDMTHLESVLKQMKSARLKLIVTDGVFSLFGTTAPLRNICKLADEYNSLIFLDECHSTAVLGKQGRGTEEYFGLQGEVDIINSTIGKALGVNQGGYTTGPKELIDLLRQLSKSFRYTKTLSPSAAAAGCVALDIMMRKEGAQLLNKLRSNIHKFREGMTNAGFVLSQAEDNPIIPVMIGDDKKTVEMADELLTKGIFAGTGVTEPVVPKGKSFLRVQISTLHTQENIEQCVDAFIELGKNKMII